MSRDAIIDLGEWAEDKFSALCSRAGVTRNRSIQDRTGWDYLIEFPPPAMPGVPADLCPTETSARIQVKSKRSGKAVVSLRLSNAVRFAKDPLPCFVVLFVATDGREPVHIYAKHFWAEEIERALKRARQAHVDGTEDLHKLSITLSFGAQDRHDSDLLEWMAATIRSQAERYSETKNELVRTVGFADGFLHGDIQFNSSDLEALIDHQIGLSPTPPPITVTLKERRFGIEMPKPLFAGQPDFAHLRSHPQPCRLRVRGEQGEDVWLDGQIFAPAFSDLPLHLRKFRIVADFVEIVISGTSAGTVTFHLGGELQRSLPGLRALANVLKAAEDGPIQFLLTVDDNSVLGFGAPMSTQRSSEELQQLSNVIACLEKASAGLLPPDLTLSLDEIDRAWNSVVEFNGFVSGTDMKARFVLDRDFPEGIEPARCIYLYDYVNIGGWAFLAVVRRPIERFEPSGAAGSIAFGEARVVEAAIRRGDGADHLHDLLELYRQARLAAGRGVLEVYGGSYAAMRAGATGTPMLLT